jgi:hypothetical protein
MNGSVLTTRSDPRRRSDAPPPGRCRRCGRVHGRALTRRGLLGAAAGASLVALGAGGRRPGRALAQDAGAVARPIPGGIDLGDGNVIHVYDYSQGFQPGVIVDFRGLVGIHHLRGEGTVTTGGGGGGLSTPTATGDRLVYDTDMRFMQGTYVGEDGQEHEGTFGFV